MTIDDFRLDELCEALQEIESLQQRCAEHGEARVKLAEQIVEDGKRITALKAALRAAQEAMGAMWKDYDRGEHGGSPGEWIAEAMMQVDTALTSSEGAEDPDCVHCTRLEGRIYKIDPACPIHGPTSAGERK